MTETPQDVLNRRFWHAADDNQADLVVQYLNEGADIHFGEEKALCCAIERNYTNIVHILLEQGASFNVETPLFLQKAIETGNAELVELLLAHGADVHEKSRCETDMPIRNAVGLGRVDIARILVDYGANVHATWLSCLGCLPERCLLDFAVCTSNVEMVEYLLAAGAKTQKELELAIFSASLIGNTRIVDILAQALGNKPLSCCPAERSPLCRALYHGFDTIACTLMKHGARCDDETAFEMALSFMRLKPLCLFLGSGRKYDFNPKVEFPCSWNGFGRKWISKATHNRKHEIVKMVVLFGQEITSVLDVAEALRCHAEALRGFIPAADVILVLEKIVARESFVRGKEAVRSLSVRFKDDPGCLIDLYLQGRSIIKKPPKIG